jgi:hypothetical protein
MSWVRAGYELGTSKERARNELHNDCWQEIYIDIVQ